MEVGSNLTRNDYRILTLLAQDKCISEIFSYTLKTISEKTNLSDNTVRNSLNKFIDLRFIKIGAKVWRANSYYITEQGVQKLNVLLRKEI
jgi:RIO-like serine/threonine protein kinase